jgi:hypothetical protein
MTHPPPIDEPYVQAMKATMPRIVNTLATLAGKTKDPNARQAAVENINEMLKKFAKFKIIAETRHWDFANLWTGFNEAWAHGGSEANWTKSLNYAKQLQGKLADVEVDDG